MFSICLDCGQGLSITPKHNACFTFMDNFNLNLEMNGHTKMRE